MRISVKRQEDATDHPQPHGKYTVKCAFPSESIPQAPPPEEKKGMGRFFQLFGIAFAFRDKLSLYNPLIEPWLCEHTSQQWCDARLIGSSWESPLAFHLHIVSVRNYGLLFHEMGYLATEAVALEREPPAAAVCGIDS